MLPFDMDQTAQMPTLNQAYLRLQSKDNIHFQDDQFSIIFFYVHPQKQTQLHRGIIVCLRMPPLFFFALHLIPFVLDTFTPPQFFISDVTIQNHS